MRAIAASRPYFTQEFQPVERRAGPPTAARWGLPLLILVVLCWGASAALGFVQGLAALSVVGFAAATLGFFQPVVGLLGIGILCTTDAVTRIFLMTGGVLRWNTFNYWLLLVAMVYVLKLASVRSVPLRLLFALICLLMVQLLYSPDLKEGVQHVLGALSALGLAVYVFRAAKIPHIWTWVALVNGTVGALGGLIYTLSKANLPVINANAYSYFPLTALLSVCLAFAVPKRTKWASPVLLLLAVANAGWIYLSGSRGGILIMICCVLFIVAASRNILQSGLLLGLGAVIAVVISTQFGEMGNRTLARIEKMFSGEVSSSEKTSGRSDLMLAGIDMFVQNPQGVGTGGFKASYSKVSTYYRYGAGDEKAAHSGWVKILAENGVPGILMMVIFVASFAFAGWNRRRHGLLPIGFLITATLSLAFLSTEFQGKGLWFLVASGSYFLNKGHTARNLFREIPKSPLRLMQERKRRLQPA